MPLLDTSRLKPEYQGYKRLPAAVGSGASASVMPESLLNGHVVRPSDGSRAGVSYLAADGGRIPIRGE
eukprot:5151070-Alexandrium_andersonii.AAC.1